MNPDTLASDLLGYAAAAMVLVTFLAQTMTTLRAIAIASNVLFISYALVAWLPPVLVLHALLLPLNAWRLWQASRAPATRRHERIEPSFALRAPALATFRTGPPPCRPAMPPMQLGTASSPAIGSAGEIRVAAAGHPQRIQHEQRR